MKPTGPDWRETLRGRVTLPGELFGELYRAAALCGLLARGAPLEPAALAEQALDLADALSKAAERRDSSGAQPEEGAG